MIQRINISNLRKYAEETTGTNNKVWLDNTKKLFLFKEAVIREDGTSVYNDVAECIAASIGNLIKLNCAEYFLCEYKGALGNFSPNFTTNSYGINEEELISGVHLIYQVDPHFKNTWLENPKTKDLYTVSLVLRSLESYGFVKEGIEMIIFSLLIGNYDCNPSNYGIIKNHKTNTIRFAPLYDFGTSMGITYSDRIINKYITSVNGVPTIVNEEMLNDFIQNQVISKIVLERHFQKDDKERWYNYRREKNLPNKAYDIKIMKYQAIFEYLTSFYPDEMVDIMQNIETYATRENISDIVDAYSDHMDANRTLMAKEFAIRRASWMVNYYKNHKYVEMKRSSL